MDRPQKVAQLKITAFTKPDRSGSGESFSFLINPESWSSRHVNRFNTKKAINTSGRKADYSLSDSKEMSLQLTLDTTLMRDALPGAAGGTGASIKEQVDKFLKYCYYMDGAIHEPRYLLVEWGKFSFKCRLKSANVSYTLFNDQGEPLRATLDTVLVEDMPDDMRLGLENKQSPDITHMRIVKAGHTLTGLTREVYGDASHYPFVAAANQLDHFRSLQPGTRLYFPPLPPQKQDR